jgi:tetratricopeptide (TPR) repeat protein
MGDYPAAAASLRQALVLFRETEYRLGQASALEGLGRVQLETGDYPAAATSLRQALHLYRGASYRAGPAGPPDSHRNRSGEASALNSLGRLASRTTQIRLARDHHSQALAIARDIGMPLEEGRALEGIGQSYLHQGNPRQAIGYLQQALATYQRIGSSYAGRVQETLRQNEPMQPTPQNTTTARKPRQAPRPARDRSPRQPTPRRIPQVSQGTDEPTRPAPTPRPPSLAPPPDDQVTVSRTT